MKPIAVGESLPAYEIVARNYGAAHANKIHSDAGAAEHGFAGALVPGVAMYAYLTRPLVDALGVDWLVRGAMSAKFIHPVYDADAVRAEAKVVSANPLELELRLFNQANELCAVGQAGLPEALPLIESADFPLRPMPINEARWPATIAAVKAGDVFGSLEFTLDLAAQAEFLENMVDDSPLYRGADAACHPAFWIAQANEVFMQNFALGMWIHTSSETQHYALAREGERLTMRGRVAETSERRGHEIVMANLAIFGEANRVIATIKHSAIIRLKK
ncbi:MAG: MaoC family dehydratase [Acidobacteria bacterium]|nr:MaoC family dehydratase [Acidobacteriota bacterium]